MIKSIGVDIIEIKRIEKLIKTNKKFLKKIFTEKEIKIFSKKKNKSQHFAVRFAAKESIIKALGKRISFNQIEILNEKSGKPKINFLGRTKKIVSSEKIFLSLSHAKDYAIAIAILIS